MKNKRNFEVSLDGETLSLTLHMEGKVVHKALLDEAIAAWVEKVVDELYPDDQGESVH